MAREKINEIVRTGIFPTLGDMLNLEKLLDIDGSSESLVYCMGFGIPNKST